MALGEEKDIFIFIFIFLLSVILLVAEDLGAANIIVFVWSQWVAATLGWGDFPILVDCVGTPLSSVSRLTCQILGC